MAFDSDAVDVLARAFAGAGPADRRLDFLADCVGELDPKARELCRLRYTDDFPPAAVGGRLRAGANAVAKALQPRPHPRGVGHGSPSAGSSSRSRPGCSWRLGSYPSGSALPPNSTC